MRATGASGSVHIELGPVERWVVGIVAASAIGLGMYVAKSFADRLDRQGDQLTEVAKQQAVANAQLTALGVQMADVPGLSQRLAELQGQVARNTDDIRILRGDKGDAK